MWIAIRNAELKRKKLVTLQILGFTPNLVCVIVGSQVAWVGVNVLVWSMDLTYGRNMTSCTPQTLFKDQHWPSGFKAEAHSNRMLNDVTTTNCFLVWMWTSHIILLAREKIAASVRMLNYYIDSPSSGKWNPPSRSIKYTWLTQRPGVSYTVPQEQLSRPAPKQGWWHSGYGRRVRLLLTGISRIWT